MSSSARALATPLVAAVLVTAFVVVDLGTAFAVVGSEIPFAAVVSGILSAEDSGTRVTWEAQCSEKQIASSCGQVV